MLRLLSQRFGRERKDVVRRPSDPIHPHGQRLSRWPVVLQGVSVRKLSCSLVWKELHVRVRGTAPAPTPHACRAVLRAREKHVAAMVEARSGHLSTVAMQLHRRGVGLGVVDIKVNHIESADEIARRIEAAEQKLGAGRVKFIHPDCGFWMLKRSVADRKIAALAKGRDLFEGR